MWPYFTQPIKRQNGTENMGIVKICVQFWEHFLTRQVRHQNTAVTTEVQHHRMCTETNIWAICVHALSTSTHCLIQTLIDVWEKKSKPRHFMDKHHKLAALPHPVSPWKRHSHTQINYLGNTGWNMNYYKCTCTYKITSSINVLSLVFYPLFCCHL